MVRPTNALTSTTLPKMIQGVNVRWLEPATVGCCGWVVGTVGAAVVGTGAVARLVGLATVVGVRGGSVVGVF